MDFFDSLGETLSSAGKAFGNKTKEVAGATKLSIQITQEETKLQKAYAALGEAYYAANRENMPEQYAVCAADIEDCEKRLQELKENKQVIKNQKHCRACGAVMPNEDRFCGKCGAENEVITKEKADEDEEVCTEEVPAEEAAEEVSAEEAADEM